MFIRNRTTIGVVLVSLAFTALVRPVLAQEDRPRRSSSD